MTEYNAPLDSIKSTLDNISNIEEILSLPGCEELDMDLVEAVLEEASKLARSTLSPLKAAGDREGANLINGTVKTPKGWKQAHDLLADGGWIGLCEKPEYGGQGFPFTVAAAVSEIWQAANPAFSLCNVLTQGAISAIELAGTEAQKLTYLPRLINGTWTGTMNLTEPQAGSNLAAIKSMARPDGDRYRVSGQKIFISYGDHDLSENIIHLVLARTPDAPEGIRGLSLFIVPKFLIDEDGNPSDKNDVTCVSLEHKLGIHASPTAVMSYGEKGGAVGYLLGELHCGIQTMFIMMNAARYEVGISGLAVAEAAYQIAKSYALERKQGIAVGDSEEGSIARHPDVMRMLLDMKAKIAAMRAVAYFAVAARDRSIRLPDENAREICRTDYDFLIPIVKGWTTETSQEVVYDALQVHGGWGFVEETGIAQSTRDARINTLYEGTTGIQSADLTFRKTVRDKGETVHRLISQICHEPMSQDMRSTLHSSASEIETYLAWIEERAEADPRAVAATADSYLRTMGAYFGGALLAKAAYLAEQKSSGSDEAKTRAVLAWHYLKLELPKQLAALKGAVNTSSCIGNFAEDQL